MPAADAPPLMIELRAMLADADDEAIASVLDELARVRGSARLRHVAAILRGKKGGRPAENDGAALDEARRILRSGRQISERSACLLAARRFAGDEAAEVLAERLRRKLRKEFGAK